MFPAPFDYRRPDDLDGVLHALAELGDRAKLLAGGHSLLPLMKFRLATPEVLIDVGRIPELRSVRDDGAFLAIGAALTHQEVLDHPAVRARCGFLGDVIRVIGDPQVRHRGTIGGAAAHGDPAGDLPAALLALEAQLTLASARGRRTVAAADFYLGFLETAIGDDEVLVEVQVPTLDASWSWAYEKFARVSHAWAIVGACALLRRQGGVLADVRVGLTHMGSVPVRAPATEAALVGTQPAAVRLRAAADRAADGTRPPEDSNGDTAYRQHLARVLTRRALERALADL